ncbi:MAG: ABC transporter ATP-binding protein [Acidobacteria bacterium]|nr:MAG: ABC transporter ATP-binding protein [Acidobacteriota bacterium]
MSSTDESSGSSPVIEFREVGYKLANQSLLCDISFSVSAGETLVLLGRSGAGKTTALKLINRLLTPTYGEIQVNSRSTISWDPILLLRSIGWVIQESGLFPHYSVEGNIAVVPRLERWPEDRVRARVSELMQLVGLDANLRTRYPHQLSGGQRQRVGVARALAADPRILLMDEPFGALDPITRAELQKEFLDLQRRLRKTVVMVTHDLHEALRLASRIALLDSGKLIGLFGSQEFAHSQDERVLKYVSPFREAALPI